MKLAIAGKGGVGKTTLVAQLAREAVGRGYRVLAVDADTDPNLATTLGFPEPVAPLAEEDELVAERAGSGGFIRLNPTVDDIPDRYAVTKDGIRLLVLGGLRGGGDGCACAANVLLRALLGHLLVKERDAVLVDMEAGIEHLGRGTVRHVDALLIVVEGDRKAIETAERTLRLAHDLGIERIFAVGNRIRSDEERTLIADGLPPEVPLLGVVPYLDAVRAAALRGPLPEDPLDESIGALWDAIEERMDASVHE
ncbi:MAG: AAA family ATPase [Candidatus Bipolaricaulota bacterium]|nr:MAG: AAA family ATPase [Candidatus Bipolaricaulota bacterium]